MATLSPRMLCLKQRSRKSHLQTRRNNGRISEKAKQKYGSRKKKKMRVGRREKKCVRDQQKTKPKIKECQTMALQRHKSSVITEG